VVTGVTAWVPEETATAPIPGVMVTLSASLTSQLKVELSPSVMVGGLVEKEWMTGLSPVIRLSQPDKKASNKTISKSGKKDFPILVIFFIGIDLLSFRLGIGEKVRLHLLERIILTDRQAKREGILRNTFFVNYTSNEMDLQENKV